MHKRDKLMI